MKILLPLLGIVLITSWVYFDRMGESVAGGDPLGYYIHLPSALLYHDVGDYKTSLEHWHTYYPNQINLSIGAQTPIGKTAVKYPVGVAILQSPFFAAAHVYCTIKGIPADGFNYPYRFLCNFSAIVYALFGIWLIGLVLKRLDFTQPVRLGTLALLALGTNLFYFSTYNTGMAHAYLFFLTAALLYTTLRFYETPSWKWALWVGLSAGAIALTRLSDIIFVLIPMLWGAGKGHGDRLWQYKKYIFAAAAAFLLPLIPQAFYWKTVSGRWWFDAYVGESFNFKHPHLIGGIFGASNGWLCYTPVMFFALCGLFFLKKYARPAFWPVWVILPLHLYIIYSWWCWNYINGLGSRPMVDLYPLLALPLAACIAAVSQRKATAIVSVLAGVFFIALNIFQSWQLSKGILWSENGNYAYYRAIWGATHESKTGVVAYQSSEYQPDTRSWQMITTLGVADMEDSTDLNYTSLHHYRGRYGFSCKDAEYSPGVVVETDNCKLEKGDYLHISVRAFLPPGSPTNGNEAAALVAELNIKDGDKVKVRSIKPAIFTSLPPSIWSGGETGRWAEADYWVSVPKKVLKKGLIKVYVWNPPRQPLVIDDLVVEQWRP